MEYKNKDILWAYLKDTDDYAGFKKLLCPPIYLLGGSACILGDYLNRATTDFDLVDVEYPENAGRVLKMLEKFDLLDQFVTPLAPGYKIRAKKLEGLSNIEVFILSKEDIIVSKLSRYATKDKEDIKQIITDCDKDLIKDLIIKVQKRDDFSAKVKEYFVKNARTFMEEFNV